MKVQYLAKSRHTSAKKAVRKLLIIFFSLYLLFSVGTSVYADPLPIEEVRDLQNMRDSLDGDYYLANDIDASETVNWNNGAGFDPVGVYEVAVFTGTFDGRGHVISNLYINRDPENEHFNGLFGAIEGATIENVGMVDVDITAGYLSGALVGTSYFSSITNCYANGSVTGCGEVGGLVGNFFGGSITNSYASVSVDGDGYIVGGLVGYFDRGSITNCYATGSVNCSAYDVGGLIGRTTDVTTSNCYATGSVHGSFKLGGLIGQIDGQLSHSEVTNSYATGSVTGSRIAGGLIGYNTESVVANSYATGRVNVDRIIGGLVGDFEGSPQQIFTHNFWDTETTGQNEGTSQGNVNGITGATTEEMQDQATFENVGWDFEALWMMRGYPHFQWEHDVLGGFLKGFVFDAENDSLLEGVRVTTSYGFSTLSDSAGYWYLERFVGDSFSVTVAKQGYNDSTSFEQNVGWDDTLEMNIGLLHPEILLSDAEIVDELEYGGSAEHHLTIQNDGNGPLEWSVTSGVRGDAGDDLWSVRQLLTVSEITDDERIEGVIFDGQSYYCTGSNGDEPNTVYHLSRNGELLDSFPQPGHSRYGFKDIEWDGDLIWGSGEDTVYALNREGDVIHRWRGPFSCKRRLKSVAGGGD